jgi:hypothetical protein
MWGRVGTSGGKTIDEDNTRKEKNRKGELESLRFEVEVTSVDNGEISQVLQMTTDTNRQSMMSKS